MKAALYLIFIFIYTISVNAQDRITGHDFATRSEVIAKNGMAATESAACHAGRP